MPERKGGTRVAIDHSVGTVFVQGPGGPTSVLALLRAVAHRGGYRRFSVCAAYATAAGVKALRSVPPVQDETEFRWLFGLDDCFTTPAALRAALGCHRSATRVVESQTGRFHAKAFLFENGQSHGPICLIGSANATLDALCTNCETFSLVQMSSAEADELWTSLSAASDDLTNDLLIDYTERFNEVRAARGDDLSDDTDATDTDEIDLGTIPSSETAWIEFGRNTGGGNQLDIVKALATFLGLPEAPSRDQAVEVEFTSPRGRMAYALRFTKGMWRFMNLQQGFDSDLRPDPDEPSPYVLVIRRRTASPAELSIVDADSDTARDLEERSSELGLAGNSNPNGPGNRKYGWL